MVYKVKDLFQEYSKELDLELVAGDKGLSRTIKVPETQRPGLTLSGYLKGHAGKRILVFGKVEFEYLKALSQEERKNKLGPLFNYPTPAIIVTRRYKPFKELVDFCNEFSLPLFRSKMTTMSLMSQLMALLNAKFAPKMTVHGTLVEVFGVGVLIQGESSVGKSEAALGLIERGHRLISDDVVRVSKTQEHFVEGKGVNFSRHHMEVRGIGIINVAHLYGAVCVRDSKAIDLVVRLETWNDQTFYDRLGLEQKTCDLLGVDVPFHVLPVKPGRDVVLLLETLALNHRLKNMGYNSAQEFNAKLLEAISKKQNSRRSAKRVGEKQTIAKKVF
jgi:HPr kinase/phosphorylase